MHMLVSWRSAASLVLWVAAGAVAARLLRLKTRWRLRTLPLPRASPLLGNLPAIVSTPGGFTGWRDAMYKVYGKVYQSWLGSHPVVVLSDPDAVRKLAAQTSKRPDMTFMMGCTYRAVRRIYEAALLPAASLSAHEPMLQHCVSQLVARLAHAADSGKPVDMVAAFGDLTMQAIGFVAFGVDLHCLDTSAACQVAAQIETGSDWLRKPGSPEFGRRLTSAARDVFHYTAPRNGSRWKNLARLFPELATPLRLLSSLFPDEPLRKEVQALRDLIAALLVMVRQWKEDKAAQEGSDGPVTLPAISDRGFLAKLLSMAETEGLSELDVMAQIILGGYETTASLLSAAMYFLQREPKAQARLQAEVDAVLHGKAPSAEDMERLPYVRAVVDEALRMASPSDGVLRIPQRDFTLPDGKLIPAGVSVFLASRCFQLDNTVWPRAKEFLPERWLPGHEDLTAKHPHAYAPFGFSARLCPGYKLALMETRVTLARLAQHFTFSPAPAGLPEPEWHNGIVYSLAHLWTRVERRAV